MEYYLCIPRVSHGITDDPGGGLGTPSSSSSLGSASSSDETSPELTDDAATSEGPGRSPRREPYEMSTLMARLPFKRGLSRHYHGKSQSFTSLAKVGSLEDLAKPEKTMGAPGKRKKPKPGAAGPEKENPIGPARSPVSGYSKAISKRGSRGGVPALLVKRRPPAGIPGGGRPPAAPPHGHRPGGFPAQASTLLFA